MKYLFLSLLLFIVNKSDCQWNKFSNTLDHNLFDIESYSEDNIYAAGTGLVNGFTSGMIFRSSDGGANWDTVYHHFVDSLLGRMHKVNVIDHNIAYASNAGNRLYKTIDGGSTWLNLNLPTDNLGTATNAMYFLNSELGFVGNFYGEIFKTSDGGLTWELVHSLPFRPIYDICCPTDSICYARTSMSTKLLKSMNQGSSWSALHSAPNTFLNGGLHAINKDTIVMVTSDALIFRSIDGGASWDTIPSPVNSNYSDVYFIDNVGYAVGMKETIIKSTDFGGSWTLDNIDTTSSEQITAIHMSNSSSAFACSNLGSVYNLASTSSTNELESELENINVYPNPFTNHIKVQLKKPINGIILIYNIVGQQLQKIELVNQKSVEIDMSDISSNFVFLSFIDKDLGIRTTKKIIRVE